MNRLVRGSLFRSQELFQNQTVVPPLLAWKHGEQRKNATLLVAECLRDPRKKGANPNSLSGLSPIFTQTSNGGQHDTGEERELKRW